MAKGSITLVILVSSLVSALVTAALIVGLDAPGRGGGSQAGAAALIPISSEPVAPGDGVSVLSSVPELINFQGVLTNPGGGPVPDIARNMTFSVYDALTGGNLEWTEKQTVTTDGGLFQVLLGSFTSLSGLFDDGTPRFLEVQVETNTPLAPRQRFVSVPYAFHAGTADIANTAKTANSAITANKADLANDLDCVACVSLGELVTIPSSAPVVVNDEADNAISTTSNSYVNTDISVAINLTSASQVIATGNINVKAVGFGIGTEFARLTLDGSPVGQQFRLLIDDRDDHDNAIPFTVNLGTVSPGLHTIRIQWHTTSSVNVISSNRHLVVLAFPG